MTVKRRLFLSNILMIVIPLLLSVVILGGIRLVYFQDEHDTDDRAEDFFHEMRNMRVLSSSWNGDAAQIEAYIKNFYEHNAPRLRENLVLILYSGDVLLSPSAPPEPNPALALALSQEPPTMIVIDGKAVHMERLGEYRLVLMDTDLGLLENISIKYEDFFTRAAGILGCSILIIFLTNMFLTRFVFKKIIFALDTLKYGVSQISDGNLDYRIEYNGTDEFSAVCVNFNEMAGRLLDSVKSRQRDEESRRELIAGISHDLRTPLTAIMGYVQGIEHGLPSNPATWARYVETIKNKVRDLEQIIETLFLFSRLDLGEFPWRTEYADLEEELNHILSSLQTEYAQRGLDISLKAEIERKLWVNIDVQQMRNTIINILENSLKYKTKERAQMEICLSRDSRSRCAVIAMTDDGPGVTKESLARLFDVFYRGDASRSSVKKGHGLGLAIAAKIVKGFGGEIWAENASEGGLSIYMKFPEAEKLSHD